MSQLRTRIVSSSVELPEMECHNFFHGRELFEIIERVSNQRPYMVVCEDESGRVLSHLLAAFRRRGSLVPPYLFTQGRVYGEGDYADDTGQWSREQLFAEMLSSLTQLFRRKFCTYVEFSNLSTKMFGYQAFRQSGYIPVSWQEVHNSLHDRSPRERIGDRMARRIEAAERAGVWTREAESGAETAAFYRLLRNHHRMKLNHFIPREDMIMELNGSDNGKVFVTLYKGRVVGGSVCVFSSGNAYLWYACSLRKTYRHAYPHVMTVWHALSYAYEHNYAHFYFVDAGLPFHRSAYREFMLSFGGKPVTKYRWFRFTSRWMNGLVSLLFRI